MAINTTITHRKCVGGIEVLVPGESRRGPPPEQQPYEHDSGERRQ